MKNSKWVWIWMAVLILSANCGSDPEHSTSVDSDCKCTSSPVSAKNGLVLTFENQTVSKPANVSLLFKVATSEGVALSDLTASDFKIYEDDSYISAYESQQTIRPKPGAFKSHILLLLDLSGSVLRSDSLPALKTASKNFVSTLISNTSSSSANEIDMSIWWFDGSSTIFPVVQSFVSDANTLISGIDSLDMNMSKDSSTNLYGAVIEGVTKIKGMTGSSQTSVNVSALAIFTDGSDHAARRSKEEAINAVKNSGQNTSVYTIGLGGEIDEDVLKTLGKNGFVFASSINELTPKFEELGGRIKSDLNSHYLLQYCSPKRKGSHSLKISLTYHELSGSLTTCFCATGFEGGCNLSP